MNNKFDLLNSDDVLTVNPDTFEDLDITRTSKVIHLLEAIQECFGCDTKVVALFSKEGVECEVLKLGAKEWEKGKVRINLEFCPNQPSESPLLLNNLCHNHKEAENSL
jgi:hypothetical protein